MIRLTVENLEELNLTAEEIKIIEAVSPIVSLERTDDGALLIVKDVNGTHQALIHDGQKGERGEKGEQGEPGQQGAPGKDGVVQDVQIDGTSILNHGVANVPIASVNGNPGAIKLATGLGLGLTGANNLMITTAIDAAVKNGSNNYSPITPSNQHKSTFYALAKAAGADMASLSGETVGVYPEAQKIAIQKMLGVNETFYLLEIINLTDAGSDITTTRNSDLQGIAYAYDAFVVDIETSQSATLVCGVFAGSSGAMTKLVSYNRAAKKRFRLYVFSLGSGLWWTIGMDDSGSSGSITPTSSYSPITDAMDKISYVSAELKTGFESATIKLFGMKK